MISELDTLIDAIDQLSNGLLSPSVIRPGLLQELIMQVDIELRNNFPQYTLALSVAEMYYNIPMVKFMFLKDMLGVQIPLFLQHNTQQALNLYSLRTVPVPYHINKEISDGTETSYTWLHPKHNMLAMSYSTYIALDMIQIQNCFKFGNYYFCKDSFLTQHSTGHTCESAIFYNLEISIIKDLCTFTYYPNLKPEPTVLDSVSQLLLAHLSTHGISFVHIKAKFQITSKEPNMH